MSEGRVMEAVMNTSVIHVFVFYMWSLVYTRGGAGGWVYVHSQRNCIIREPMDKVEPAAISK